MRVLVIGASLLLCAASLGAARAAAEESAASRGDLFTGGSPVRPPLNKLGRGVANALGGWLEVPWNIGHEYTTQKDRVAGAFTGLVTGLVKGVARTGVGVFEVVTFPFPVPQGYAPVLDPLPYFAWCGRSAAATP